MQPKTSDLPTCLALTSQTRRTFLKNAGLLVVTGSLGVGLAACDSGGMEEANDDDLPPESNGLSVEGNQLVVDLTRQTELTSEGGFLLVVSVGGADVHALIVNVDGTSFKAFTSICTHQQCDVSSYNPSQQVFTCPCHGSQYDINGQVVRGPAAAPLEPFPVSRSGDVLTVTLG